MPLDFKIVENYNGEFIVALKQHSRAHMSAVDDGFVDASGWSGLCYSHAVVWLQYILKITNNTSAIDFTDCINTEFKNSHLLTSLQEQLLTDFSSERVRPLLSRIIAIQDGTKFTKSGSYDEEQFTFKDFSTNAIEITKSNIANLVKSTLQYLDLPREILFLDTYVINGLNVGHITKYLCAPLFEIVSFSEGNPFRKKFSSEEEFEKF